MKPILSITTGLLCCLQLSAQISGPVGGSAFTTSALNGYSLSWQGPGNTSLSDDQYSTFGNLPAIPGSHTDYLIASDFQFNIPANAIIDGIEASVECSDQNSRTSDYSVRIIKAQQIGNQEKATGTPYPLTDMSPIIYGGPTDLWGETWLPKHINDNFFGVAISAQRSAADGITDGRVDMIAMTVYYHINITLAVNLNSFTAVKNNKSVVVNWKTSDESSMKQYTVERSADGRVFSPISSAPARNQAAAEYSYTDNNPLSGISYYRLKMEHTGSNDTYSKIAAVSFNKYSVINLSPSPCVSCNTLYISNPSREELSVYFYTPDGKLIGKAATNTSQVIMPVLAEIKGLVYFKVLNAKNTEKGSGKLLVN